MSDYLAQQPDYSNGAWANQGVRQQPTKDKIETGHVVEKPAYQISNWIEYRQDSAIYYLLQNGLAQWDIGMYYPANAITMLGKNVYISKEPNTAQKPDETDHWELLFFTKKDGDDLKSVIKQIREEEGFLNLYVSKSKPVMDAPCVGKGYFFDYDGRDGLSNDGGTPEMLNDGNVVAKFEEVQSLDDESKRVVTMDLLQKVLKKQEAFKKDALYITFSNQHPETELGYGEWERVAQGLTLVGLSQDGNSPNWTRDVGTKYGEYSHTLSGDEIPKHEHYFPADDDLISSFNLVADQNRQSSYDAKSSDSAYYKSYMAKTSPSGGSQSHNNVQPSLVVAIWRRIK